MNRKILIASTVSALFFAGVCQATVINYVEANNSASITIDGVSITGNGGNVSNFSQSGELINFDFYQLCSFCSGTGYTNLIDPGTSAVSDAFYFSVNDSTIHVAFGSAPDLPAIPAGAIDLTTIPVQGLPSNPYYEDGTLQYVGTAFYPDSSNNITFNMQSTVQSTVPEPATLSLICLGIVGIGALRKRK